MTELVPIFVQSGYSATVIYNPESELTEVTLLLKDNLRYKHVLKAKVYPGNPCQKNIETAFNTSFEDVQQEEQRAKDALSFAIQETIKQYELDKEQHGKENNRTRTYGK